MGSTLKNDYRTPFTVKDVNEISPRSDRTTAGSLTVTITTLSPAPGQGSGQPGLIRRVADLKEMPCEMLRAGGGPVRCPDVSRRCPQTGRRDREDRCDCVISSCPSVSSYRYFSETPVKNVTTCFSKVPEKGRREA